MSSSHDTPSWWPRCGASRGKGKLCMRPLVALEAPITFDLMSCPKHGLRGVLDLSEERFAKNLSRHPF
jgi:hypothetical protein